MTYRIEPQCGHPSLMGGLHDHGPECLFTIVDVPDGAWAAFQAEVDASAAEIAKELASNVTIETGSAFANLSIHQQIRAEMMR